MKIMDDVYNWDTELHFKMIMSLFSGLVILETD